MAAVLAALLVHGASPRQAEYVWSPPQVLQAAAPAASGSTGSLAACAMAPLPAFSHIILVNRNTNDVFQMNGMYRRMAAVLEALTSQGLSVHLVYHDKSEKPQKSRPRQHVYEGSMMEQYKAAKKAAGKQLRLGIVFATALTTRLEKQLTAASRHYEKHHKNVTHKKWDGDSLSELFKENDFAGTWPEEEVMEQLHEDGLPVAVVTDDIHYMRAPYAISTSQCTDGKSGCAEVIEKYFKERELALYASAQLVFTVTMEDAPFVSERLREMRATAGDRERSLLQKPASEPRPVDCVPRVEWLPYVEEALEPDDVVGFDKRGNGMFYVGTAHPPAVRAMEWLVDEVQPRIREAGVLCHKGEPGHIYVAGNNWDTNLAAESASLRHALDKGKISFLGVLTDEQLERRMQKVRVFAAPLFNATGVATKNIFAMSRGLPLVTTTAGLQGLGLRSALDANATRCPGAVDLEDEADGFAKKVLLLQTSEELWSERSRRGLEHVEWALSAAAEVSTLKVRLGLEQTLPLLHDDFGLHKDKHASLIGARRRMTTLAQEGLRADGERGGSCAGLAEHVQQECETALRGERVALQACALETASELRALTLPPAWSQDAHLYSCPLRNEGRQDASSKLRLLHRTMLAAGYVRFDDPASERLDPEATDVQGAANHETRLWPRPQACTHRPKKMIDLQHRLLNPRQTKLVNAKRGLEFRPVLKVGSTLMRHLLPCLQPGEWEEVPQNASVRPASTVLVLQRDPISKFAAALGEVMARVFLQRCPEGQCTYERDHYEPKRVKAEAQTTLWYATAKRIYESQDFSHAKLVELVRNAALDASCDLRYYASDHFASQAGLQLQGELQNDTKVRIFDIESLGSSLEDLLASDLVETVLGAPAPTGALPDLQMCMGSFQAVNAQRMLESAARLARARALRVRRTLAASASWLLRKAEQAEQEGSVGEGSGGEAAAGASRGETLGEVLLRSGGTMAASTSSAALAASADNDGIVNHKHLSLLPSTEQLVDAIESDQPTLTTLQAAYGQDLLCNLGPGAAKGGSGQGADVAFVKP